MIEKCILLLLKHVVRNLWEMLGASSSQIFAGQPPGLDPLNRIEANRLKIQG